MLGYLLGKRFGNGYGSASTAEEVASQNHRHIQGRTFIVTGSSSGIGAETARQLFWQGGDVVMAVRNMEKGIRLARQLITEAGGEPVMTQEGDFQLLRASEGATKPCGSLLIMPLDLSSLENVRDFASSFVRLERPLHVLINNAGVMMCPHTLTADGYELQFGTNHLGHFLLTELLRPLLELEGGRVVNVSSAFHQHPYPEGIPFDDLAGTTRYSKTGAYGSSKLANVLHAQELNVQLRMSGSRVSAYSLHPGVIPSGLQAHLGVAGVLFNLLSTPFGKSVRQGAATTLYCATQPRIEHEGAVEGISYYEDCNLRQPSGFARDSQLRKRLWQVSMDCVRPFLEPKGEDESKE